MRAWLAKRTAQEILDQPLNALGVPGFHPDALIDTEAAVPPRADISHDLFRDLALGQQEIEHRLLPQLEKRFGRQFGERQEGSVRQKHALRDQRVNMRVPMNQVSERLNGPDHPRNRVGMIGGGLINGPHHLPSRPAEFAQQTPVKPKVNPQPLGNREDKLAVRHRPFASG